MPAPSAEAQIEFLLKVQQLFAEGGFTATYKCALLIALAELAIEQGQYDQEELDLSYVDIAQKFIEFYWRQTAPYSSGSPDTVAGTLVQNNFKQAKVITDIAAFQRATGLMNFPRAMRHASYSALVSSVRSTVVREPVARLQNMAGAYIQFLYSLQATGLRLLPGVSFCLRRYQPLVQQLARVQWVGHIKRNTLNAPMLGAADDLDAFLFQASRGALTEVGHGLMDIYGPICFYCQQRLGRWEVDHFIPFSLYPRDLVHNFVLAHPSCNRSKSDVLACREHFFRWQHSVHEFDQRLIALGERCGIQGDREASLAVAEWSYRNAASSGARTWVSSNAFEPLDELAELRVTGPYSPRPGHIGAQGT